MEAPFLIARFSLLLFLFIPLTLFLSLQLSLCDDSLQKGRDLIEYV